MTAMHYLVQTLAQLEPALLIVGAELAHLTVAAELSAARFPAEVPPRIAVVVPRSAAHCFVRIGVY